MASTTMESQPKEEKHLTPVYEESSQFRHWRFSSQQLLDIRTSCNAAAVDRVRRNFQEEQKAAEAQGDRPQDEPQYLSVQDEMALCRFYEKQLQGICKHLKFTDMVMATAVIYMKRFFLHNTVMDYHPKDILLTCLFLATKSESERVSIDDFGRNLKLPSTTSVLDLEFTVSQGLKFEYYAHHPYRPAYGFFLDIQTTGVDIKILKETYNKLGPVIGEILLTDLPFLYMPSQLALAAFVVAGKNNGFDAQIHKQRFGDQSDPLKDIVKAITKVLSQVTPVTKEQATQVDYRLRICMNPAKNPNSALYKKRAAQKQLDNEERRRKKAKIDQDEESEEEEE
ncbi:cyclin [Phycomyces blakesleeanus NRRL 1555(-)]|uniref:Cyclin n=1 Tax=Phycomyces blakesleeanus (strain ATCC 8743b / DSM 1359 / FGSC 10004 / NBRC 33097 / NRRL 1555) TaxID=763407 RepID=A0A167QFB1_PHYB8|nr:cyclin [Phycomyces blakesleeanus NRRL 1555(-)]OAD79614.1 cyclin [Phycomyces blakesleeanus NRRL 1555(-)]|eukprot:XP_018297654.1 cyclin [Phycomyces blakesleeanus NRRL 1555(-)]